MHSVHECSQFLVGLGYTNNLYGQAPLMTRARLCGGLVGRGAYPLGASVAAQNALDKRFPIRKERGIAL